MALPEGNSPKGKAILSSVANTAAQFSSNLRSHYEAQANALQVDITLITRANPYNNKPLGDNPSEVDRLVYGMVNNIMPTLATAEEDFVASAGKRYTEFVQNINNAMEDKDSNTARLSAKCDNIKTNLTQRYTFHTQLAREEHKLLESTIRKRLMARISQKRSQLLREKEQLDIGETNALSLNPNQFAFANPSSPGNGNKRATRNTGRRGNNNEDGAIGIDGRKRRTAANEDVEGSPAPPTLRYEVSGKDPRSKAIYSQFEAPGYSLDRLFTASELALTMDKAAEAATKFFAMNIRGEQAEDLSREDDKSNEASKDEDDEDSNAAAEMERTVSQSMHQTRGATRNAAAQIEPVAPPKEMPGRATMPSFIPVIIGSRSIAGPATPPQLLLGDVDADLTLFRKEVADPALIKKALQPTASMEYQYRANPTVPSHVFEDGGPIGSVAMSVQTSVAGQSEHDAPMSRQASTAGGVGMKRSASNAGSHLGIPDGRRVRSRLG